MKKILSIFLTCCLLASCVHANPLVPGSENAAAARQSAPAGQELVAAESVPFRAPKRVGLVAHDACKPELLNWVKTNAATLMEQDLFCTGTTGRLVAETLEKTLPGKPVRLTRFNSGPLGGDQQMGALISESGLDILIFFVDPMSAHPHAADVQALMRLSAAYNIVVATTRATADYVISSPLFLAPYSPTKPEYSSYTNRKTP